MGFSFFKASLRLFGLRGAYGLLYFVCAYYLLCDRSAVQATLAYVRRRFPQHGWWRQRWAVYRLFIEQGKNLIDRYYLLGGGPGLKSHLEGWQQMDEIIQSRQGFILLTAHLGNWQVVMSALCKLGRKVHLVMRPEDNPAVAEALRISASAGAVEIISPEGTLGGVVPIMEALKRGDIVSIMGDRSYNFSFVDVQFLGDPARFSCGAFHIAALAGCPVVVLLAAKTSVYDYKIKVMGIFRPAYQSTADKKTQLRGWVQDFARLLEDYVQNHPYQCFLFYDVWRDAAQPPTP